MAATTPRQTPRRPQVTRRDFLKRVGWTGAGVTALAVGAGRGRPAAQPASPYPDWIPASPKPPKRGGVLTRASAWDPPVIDPRLTQSVGLFQFAGLTSNRLLRYAFTDEATGYQRPEPQGRPRRVLAGEPRPARVDVQAAPGRQVAERAAAQGTRAGRRRRQVLLRGLREGGRAGVHVPGDRGHGDARLAHPARPPQDAQHAVPAERRRAGRRDLPARGPRGGRRPQEAHDRHRALHPQGAHAQGAHRAPAQPRLLRHGPALRRRVRHPLDAGLRHPHGGVPHRPERLPAAASPSEVEAVRKTNPAAVVQALTPLADAVRPGAGPGPAAVQRRAGAARHLDGHRPPEAGGHGVRGPRHPRLRACRRSTTRTRSRRRRTSGRGGSTVPRRRRSCWPRPAIPTASRRRCSTTSTSRR